MAGFLACLLIAAGVVYFLLFRSPSETGTAGPKKISSRQVDPGRPPEASPVDFAGEEATKSHASHGTNPERESSGPPGMPVLSMAEDADSYELENLHLPPMPYCIYTDAYKDFEEAAMTQSELDSNYLPAYVVPVEIEGNIAQSLFGVTQDGLWYRVLTGHFGSKEEARETLRVMMEELPGYQPEIMRFQYTVECGRFLEPAEARSLSEKLDRENVFHYKQTFPTSDGRSLARILVGCHFSKKGAEETLARLREKGFSCVVSER